MDELVSVIVPVYNTEKKLLKRCVDSVIKQVYTNWELIIIDDGSVDDVANLCDVISSADKRIHVIHQSNKGICSSRNLGIKVSSGKYIMFIDHDDVIGKDLIKENLIFFKERDIDFVKFGYNYVCLDRGLKFPFCASYDEVSYIIGKNKCLDYERMKHSGILTFIWDGIYLKKFLINNSIFFDERFKIGQEDIDYNNHMFKFFNKMVYNPKKYYTHFRYNNSTSRGMDEAKSKQLIHDEIVVLEKEWNIIKDINGTAKILNAVVCRNVMIIFSTILRKDFYGTRKEKIRFMENVIEKLGKDISYKNAYDIKEKVLVYMVEKKLFTIIYAAVNILVKGKQLLTFFRSAK